MMQKDHAPDRIMADCDLCFIDVETTGTVFGFHEIIDIACVRTSSGGDRVKREWTRRIVPRFPERVTNAAESVNGFSLEAWDDAETDSYELWREFIETVSGCIPVCHNPSFDRGFIALAASTANLDDLQVNYHWIGTESLAWPLCVAGYVDSVSLRSLCAWFCIPPEPFPHTALDGARACRSVFMGLMGFYRKRAGEVGDSLAALGMQPGGRAV